MTRQSPLIVALLAAFLLPGAVTADEEETIYLAAAEAKEIAGREGEKVTVHGITKDSSKSASGTNYVNFESSEFHLVTFASDLDQFKEGEPHEIYNDKRIAVDGVISIYRGKPQIKLTSANQVRFLAEDEIFPPVKAKPEQPAPPEPEEMKEAPVTPPKPAEEEARPKPPVDWKLYFK
ncbi:MAG: hypothetical protein P1U86_20190 [Verrucomicrobiales bacterium]|nr:hypothetical protein [Verrucomicrobiales bacterium]